MTNDMKVTDWKVFDNGKMRIRAKYGMHKIGKQEPYFSITGEIQRSDRGSWREDSCGCIHEDISAHFPELAHLVKWHLFFAATGPMYYVENAIFWWEMTTGVRKPGKYDPDTAKAFAGTVILGAVNDEDQAPDVHSENGVVSFFVRGNEFSKELASVRDVEAFLADRLPALIERFTSIMREAGVI